MVGAAIKWVFQHSHSVKDCIKAVKSQQTYSALYQNHAVLEGVRLRSEITLTCVGSFIDTNHDAINTLAAVAVAFFTLTLWRSTDKLWQASREQRTDTLRSIVAAEKAATAAAKSADAIVLSERAYIFLETIERKNVLRVTGAEVVENKVIILFRNYGRTPANVIEYKAFFRTLDHIPGPDDEVFEIPGVVPERHEVTIMIGADKPWQSPVDEPCWESNSVHFDKFGDPREGLAFYVWGRVSYRTLFEIEGMTKFKRKWVNKLGWTSVGNFDDNSAT